MLLDEMIQKGYGIGSGVSLFTCGAICTDVLWKGISPITFTHSALEAASPASEFIGAVIALPQLLLTRDNKLMGLLEALFLRRGMAYCSIFAVVVTIAVGLM
ncbi:sec61a, partial [Symbiodinium microadriaticum]